MDGTKIIYPIFERWDTTYLAERLDVTEQYITLMKMGNKPVRPKFRAKAARILRKSEAELFGPEAGE